MGRRPIRADVFPGAYRWEGHITNTLLTICLAVLLTASTSSTQDIPPANGAKVSFIVSTSWVSRHLNDSRLVLLHVGDSREYDSLHLPGARIISTREISTPRTEGSLILELPPTHTLDSVFEAKGISDSSFVVIYPGKDWFTPAARVWLTLDYLGFGERSFIMDGGMTAWREEGKPLTAALPDQIELSAKGGGGFTPHPRNDVVVTKSWVREKLQDPKVALIDARNPVYYTGRDTGNASRPGHIPGAVNLPYDSMVDSTNHFKTRAEIAELFRNAGMVSGKTVVTYCHIGQQASLLYMMAKLSGFDARMYDGSMHEWTSDPEMPVVLQH